MPELSFLTAYLPESITPLAALGLLGVAFCSALLTAALGAGGGLLLLTVLSLVLPAAAIIPVHGLIQLGANLGRAVLARSHIHWPTIGWFFPGLVLGIGVGSAVLVQLPAAVLQLLIACFVLYLSWGPKLGGQALKPPGLVALGAVTSFLTLFVGATGPLISAFLKQLFSQRFTTVATIGAALSLQHTAKIVTFSLAGFSFLPWLVFVAAMVLCGLLGTQLGLRLLGRLSERLFQRVFTLLLSVLALRLIWQAIIALSIEGKG